MKDTSMKKQNKLQDESKTNQYIRNAEKKRLRIAEEAQVRRDRDTCWNCEMGR